MLVASLVAPGTAGPGNFSSLEVLKTLDNKRGDDDMRTGWVPTAGDYRESRVLNSLEAHYEEPPPDNVLKAKTNIVGYTYSYWHRYYNHWF